MDERRIPPTPPPPPADELGVTVKPAEIVAPITEPEEAGDVTAEIKLPPELLDFLASDRYRVSVRSVQEDFKLSDDDAVFLGDLGRVVMSGQITLEDFLDAIKEEFTGKITPEDLARLQAKLVAERFVPLGDRLKPSAMEVARTRNLRLPETPHYQVYAKPLTYSGAASEIATAAGLSLMDTKTRERLRDIVMNRSKRSLTDAQLRESLLRVGDFGGLGLDAATADRTIKAMNDILNRTKVMTEDEFAAWLARKTAAAKPPMSSSPPLRMPDEPEIAEIRDHMPQTPPKSMGELEKAVATMVGRSSYHADDEYLAKRFQNIVSSRLRDVRGAADFRQLLMRDTKVGGLGLEASVADRIAKEVEDGYQEFHGAIEAEGKKVVENELAAQRDRVEIRKRREAEEHAKWFEEKIQSRKAGEAEQAKAFSALRQIAGSGPTTPLDLKTEAIEKKKFGPLIPASTPGVKVSPPSAEIAKAQEGERPTLDAMAYTGPKLMGILGELKTLNTGEFRRLAKDPVAAAKKILELVETLGQESLEKRMQGVKVFRESPLQAAYLNLVGESFRTGKPVVSLAEEKRKSGEDTLSPEEIAAVVELNSKLHY